MHARASCACSKVLLIQRDQGLKQKIKRPTALHGQCRVRTRSSLLCRPLLTLFSSHLVDVYPASEESRRSYAVCTIPLSLSSFSRPPQGPAKPNDWPSNISRPHPCYRPPTRSSDAMPPASGPPSIRRQPVGVLDISQLRPELAQVSSLNMIPPSCRTSTPVRSALSLLY